MGRGSHLARIEPINFRDDYRHAFWKPRDAEDRILARICDQADAERLLVTFLDSDDLLRNDAVEVIQGVALDDATEAIVPRNGFLFDSARWRMGYVSRESPPFFTLVHRPDEYFAGRRHHGGRGRHLEVTKRLACKFLSERIFAIHLHGRNDSSRFGTTRALDPGEARTWFERFGIRRHAS